MRVVRELARFQEAGLPCRHPLRSIHLSMTVSFRPAAVFIPLALVVLAALPSDAQALSRRDQANIEALNQRMAVAEKRYREAMVKIGNADPSGTAESNAALEDMEDSCRTCSPRTSGC